MPLGAGTRPTENWSKRAPENGADEVMVDVIGARAFEAEKARGVPSEPRRGTPTVGHEPKHNAASDKSVLLAYFKKVPK